LKYCVSDSSGLSGIAGKNVNSLSKSCILDREFYFTQSSLDKRDSRSYKLERIFFLGNGGLVKSLCSSINLHRRLVISSMGLILLPSGNGIC